ncbi:MAG: DUF2764 family protein [Bacteroidales bacterium]|mgnify:FL=1|nr:DUF2764 family protein [Bacteroidales bacterium]
MKNYHYIVASLPTMAKDLLESEGSVYERTLEQVFPLLDSHDQKLARWISETFEPERRGSLFYVKARRLDNSFLKSFIGLDRKIRLSQVKFLSESLGPQVCEYAQGELPETIDGELAAVFAHENILDREKALDRYKWDQIDAFTEGHYFDMDVILAFLAKARIIDRWRELDPVRGEAFFKELISSVRGTFKGVPKE